MPDVDATPLTATQVAVRLGVHPDDVRKWMRTEQCPVVRIGRRQRIPAAWVDQQIGR